MARKVIVLGVSLIFITILVVFTMNTTVIFGQNTTGKVTVNGVEDITTERKVLSNLEELEKWLLEESGTSKENVDLIIKMEGELEKARKNNASKDELVEIVRIYSQKLKE